VRTFSCPTSVSSSTVKILLRCEGRSGKRAKLRTVAAGNNRVDTPDSVIACLRHKTHTVGAIRNPHPVRGASLIRHRANRASAN